MTISAPTPPSAEGPQTAGMPLNPAPVTPWDTAGHAAPPAYRPLTLPIARAGTLAIIGCAAYLVGTAATAAFLVESNDTAVLATPEALFGIAALVLLAGGGILSYVTLNLWLVKARNAALAQGYPAPATWKIWAGWLIPFYSLVAPYRVMKELTFKAGTSRTSAPLVLWWAGWLAAGLSARLSDSAGSSTTMFQVTALLCVLSLAASYAGLAIVIRRISAAMDAPLPAATS